MGRDGQPPCQLSHRRGDSGSQYGRQRPAEARGERPHEIELLLHRQRDQSARTATHSARCDEHNNQAKTFVFTLSRHAASSECRTESDLPMHWLSAAAARAGIAGAGALDIPDDTGIADSWDIASRRLGLSAAEVATLVAPSMGLSVADFDQADTAALGILSERIARQ